MTSPTFDNNAFTMLSALLDSWGLSSLSGDVRDMLTAGDSTDVVPIKLRETKAYKERFSANAARIKAGLPALSEAEFLSTEAALRNVVRRYVGSGTYDTRDQTNKWISGDLSPSELNNRMSVYQDNYLRWGQAEKDAWSTHGLTPADAIKAAMDPSVTESTLKKNANIYSLGAASVQAFHDDRALDAQRLGQLTDAGVTADQAVKGYQEIAGRQDYESFLARTTGENLSQADQENAALLGDQQAEQKRRKILATDQGRFNENYIGGQNTAGKSRQGSY